ncbi:MAG: hypothetical protein P4M00_08145 [Azospirillaceae bacterium]|nr:hypothetical protein [Azospirillaceae bacterium]
MMRRLLCLLPMLGLILGLCRCSAVPVATPFTVDTQPRVQSAAHWQVIADHVAAAVSDYLVEKSGRKPDEPRDPVVLMANRVGKTLFAEVFQQDLTTAFVQRGHAVATQPRTDLAEIRYDVILVAHRTPRDNATLPGPYTALGSGVYVGSALARAGAQTSLGLLGGTLVDAVRVLPDETQTELVLTISIEKNGFFAYRDSAVFYINDPDTWQYYALTPDSVPPVNAPAARLTGQMFGTDMVECALRDGSRLSMPWTRCRAMGGQLYRSLEPGALYPDSASP